MRRRHPPSQMSFLPPLQRLWRVFVLVTIALPGLPGPAIAGCDFNPLCNPVYFVCCTLDKEGTAASCSLECPINEVRFIDYTPGTMTSRYEFKGQATYQASGSAACPPEVKSVKGLATWQQDREGLGGIAKEEIFWEAPFVSGGWTRLVSTTSRCTSNPWLSENAPCQLLNKEPATSAFPEPYPRSAKTLSENLRQSLMFAAFSGEPPTIKAPEQGAVLDDGKVIFVAQKFVPDHPSIGIPQVEVQFVLPVWPGMEGGNTITNVVTLSNNSAVKLVELEPGTWLVQTRVKSPVGDSPWSLQKNIEVVPHQPKSMVVPLKNQLKRTRPIQ